MAGLFFMKGGWAGVLNRIKQNKSAAATKEATGRDPKANPEVNKPLLGLAAGVAKKNQQPAKQVKQVLGA